MHTKPHTIITASDARCGDFLVTHWLGSLRENVVLERADVVVLDFGLTTRQRAALDGVRVVAARCEGKAKVSRYAETTRFLEKHDYDQVLAVDCGDLIFQRDVSHLFETHKDRLRGVLERYPIPMPILLRGTRGGLRRSIRERLRGRSMVNVGFLLGPSEKMQDLGHTVGRHMAELEHDQPLVSCLLHESDFEALDETYNFVPWTARRSFYVENGIFHTNDGERPAVVHNTGLKDPFRIVRDFGYGPGHNRRIRTPYLWVASAWSRFRSFTGGSEMLRRSSFLSLAALALCLGDSARSQSVDEIEACFRANMPEKTSVQTIKLRSMDRSGGKRTLGAKLYWKRTPEGFSRTLIEVESPPSDSGSTYLWLERKGGEDMFIYLPELQRVRRIHPRTASGSLFGTDFSYEDVQHLQRISPERASVDHLPDATLEGREVSVVRSVLTGTEESPPQYESIVYFIDRESCLPLKIELYGANATLHKVAQADPTSITREGKGWVARSVSIRDLENETESEIIIEKIELDAEVHDKVFSVERLQRRGH